MSNSAGAIPTEETMSEDIVRINCCKDGCGTFPMDRALRDRYKRTGEWWQCPAGHRQHFTESTEQKLRERVEELEQEVERQERKRERSRKRADDLWDMYREERDRREFAESRLLDYATGVVEIADETFRWSCECDSRSRSTFDTVEDARDALHRHTRRNCPLDLDDEAEVLADYE